MGRFLTYRVPISKCVCNDCRVKDKQHQISTGNLNFSYIVSEPEVKEGMATTRFTVQVDIRRIKWIHDGNGGYSAKAQMIVLCPRCDKEHEIDQVIEAPKLFFEKSRKCDACGGELSFQEEELEIEDMDGMPFVHVSGKLICEKCKRASSFSTNAEASETMQLGEKPSLAISCGRGEKIVLHM